ncbi:MAG: 50S ribosomal protein L21e [Euryarchaeota archaeon]|nr:50S ribosomal protein L21e [Euryarchaeota archaeon]
MARRSHGLRSKSRLKLRRHPRERGLSPISKIMQEFKEGDRVHITIDSSLHKGQPHPRFHGRTGVVTGKRGRAYIVTISDGNKIKEIITYPEHLKLQ